MQPDYIYGLIGGLIIGTAGAVYLLANGRIMGASGILGGVVDGTAKSAAPERLSFMAGLILVPAIVALTIWQPTTHISQNAGVLIAAGLLVGLGTRVANGCTSGHGVCGISRLSIRGIVATVVYIAAGALGVVLFRHTLGVM